jgi:hypothetical protein
MKPYGLRHRDDGCCPGHDKYGGNKWVGHYNHRNAYKAWRRAAKKRARRWITMNE